MKKLIVLSVAAALTMSTQTVLAADPSASTSPKAQATTSDLAEFDKQMAQMQQNMKAMQEQMDKILKQSLFSLHFQRLWALQVLVLLWQLFLIQVL